MAWCTYSNKGFVFLYNSLVTTCWVDADNSVYDHKGIVFTCQSIKIVWSMAWHLYTVHNNTFFAAVGKNVFENVNENKLLLKKESKVYLINEFNSI